MSTLLPDASGAEKSLAATLADLARDLQREQVPDDVMVHSVHSAVALVPGAQEASISLVRSRRHVLSAAVTSDVARGFDAVQGELGEGPCLAAIASEPVVRADDLAGDPRWPRLGARAGELGVRSMLCFQLFVHENTLGALNLLSAEASAFDEEAETVGAMVAAHAAVALAGAQKFDHLRTALANRDVIGQAKGILMERFKVDADRAFDLLTRASQDRNVKLHRLAVELTRTGSLER
ncbi:GAF and ANTAR domain-containing protein [Kineococcus sp. LSe6-4]|uniref:GAF and ANTAR domain-containing protein n=1 Tax=Kineococcus halophytocola TaxID=3234027 RepID=A0ABV4H624_9ACTN